jgi:hypothetical protein
MALQPFVGLWALFQFLDFYTVARTLWTGDQPVTKALPAHRTAQIRNERTQILMPQLGFEPRIPMFERAKTVHVSDRAGPLWSVFLCHCLQDNTWKWNDTLPYCYSLITVTLGSISFLFTYNIHQYTINTFNNVLNSYNCWILRFNLLFTITEHFYFRFYRCPANIA